MAVIYVRLTKKILFLDKIRATCFWFVELLIFRLAALKTKAKQVKTFIFSLSSCYITEKNETADAFVHYYAKYLQIWFSFRPLCCF